MDSNLKQQIYFDRYLKHAASKHYLYRSEFDIFEDCAKKQKNCKVNLFKEHLIFSNSSLLNLIISKESDQIFLSEALFKTYPTKFLTKNIVKQMTKHFKSIDYRCIFSIDLENNKNLDELFVYDSNENKFFEISSSELTNYSDVKLYIKCFTENVEQNIAGSIVYDLYILDNDLLSINLSETIIKDLIDIGTKFGYDYIAYSGIYSKQKKSKHFYIKFESKFQLSDIIISNELYHIAPLSMKEKILKNGLVPKSKTYLDGTKLNHSDRVYLFNGYDENIILSYLKHSNKVSYKYSDFFKILAMNKSFALFKIDRSIIDDLILFRDNIFKTLDKNKPTAIYTYNNIKPEAIQFVKEIYL